MAFKEVNKGFTLLTCSGAETFVTNTSISTFCYVLNYSFTPSNLLTRDRCLLLRLRLYPIPAQTGDGFHSGNPCQRAASSFP